MTTEAIAPAEEKFDLVAVFRAAAASETRDRKFWITLGVALMLHLAILIGIVRSPTRQMGDPNSTPDAVSVSFVTEAELRDATTGSDGGAAAPAQQPTPPPPPPPQVQQPPPEPPTPPQPAEQAAQPPPPQAQPAPQPPEPAEPVPAQPAPKAEALAKAEENKAPDSPELRDSLPADAAPEKKAEEAERVKSDAEPPPKEAKETKETKETKEAKEPKDVRDAKEAHKELEELLKLPDPTTLQQPKQQQQTKRQQPQPQQKQAMRQPQADMTMPPDAMRTPSFDGRSAGVQRPAGITRSGANDDFARGVVRALRQTMPQMNVLGRVTVRILINQNGNIQSVEVVSRSENSDLNRAVVFSTKQASFPFPPNGATELDRTFTITYIYH